ncbi:PH domain-containing protein [Microbacterium esteraromaticum]|uniref:PH domain-containing protein n=1 Tax=Microbacterium esteraromaticum TaxID=57043 RepID=UPI000B35963C|nr:PH domain-containing protein [Microbacterium esteraromaticum]
MAGRRAPRAFPATGSLVLLIFCAVVALALLVDAAVRSGTGNALLLAPWPLLVLWAVYVAGWGSDVRADESGVQVQNLLRRIWMPWSRVSKVTMRWQLEITLDDGHVVRCFGGPARSRPRRLAPGRVKEEVTESDDGIAALRKKRAEAQQTDAGVERSWDWTAIGVLAALLIWAAAAVALTR